MAEIISCAKDTQLHSFPDLEQLFTSPHVGSNGSDCQFFGSSKLVIRANKNSGVELLRMKDGDPSASGVGGSVVAARSIATVKKIMIENLYCVACPKTANKDEIAIGTSSGTVRFMNYKKANFTKRFDSERITIGVTFMDFNATDDLLAAVFENGLVNVYGMKTNSKLHTLPFDKNTTKARFHPTKRFHMTVASYSGSVLLFDTQAKKMVFSAPTAHIGPCRDVAMVATYPDYLFSVGYDSVINVFDARRKEPVSRIESNYPFESLAIAEDAHHLAVGNLKGFVYGYDLRNLKDPLKMKKIHQSSVSSVAFVPQSRDGSSRRSMIELEESRKVSRGGGRISEGGTHVNVAPEKRLERLKLTGDQSQQQQQQHQSPDQHDSFMGEIDLFLQRREAPMDCLSRLSSSSRLSVESRNSMHMVGNNYMGFLDDLSDCNIDPEGPPMMGGSDHDGEREQVSGSGPEPEPSVNDSFVNVNRLLKRVKADGGRANISAADRLHRKGAVDNLENIREEGSDIGEMASESVEGSNKSSSSSSSVSSGRNATSSTTSASNSQKSSTGRVLADSQHENKTKSPPQESRISSDAAGETTVSAHGGKSDKENKTRPSMVTFEQELYNASTPEPPTPSTSATTSGGSFAPAVAQNGAGNGCVDRLAVQSPTIETAGGGQQLSAEIADLRKTMLDQFQDGMLQRIDAEQALRSHLWMGMFNLWRETQRKLESVEQIVSTGFGLLLPRDEFVQQFLGMKAENEALKKRLAELEGQGKRGN